MALHNTIKNWLDDEHPKLSLLRSSIPQHGLQYKASDDYIEEIVLIGYVKSPNVYMPWINDGHYVVRLKDGNKQPKGAVSLTRKVMMVQHVALYTIDNGENRLIGLFDIKDSESIPIKTNSEELKRAGYPSKSENKSYLLYSRY